MKIEQLKSEAREKYLQKGSYSGQTKAGSCGAGFYTSEDVDTLITTAYNAGLERAVEVVEMMKYVDPKGQRAKSRNRFADDITTQLQAEVNKDN